ncbi:methyltransferase [Yoonia vestfoldensis]|uniref:methyltransferase n=1 Tax=Yoonia vestfoldensis TaxID=245188 RepID=UPI0003A2C168|nr:methyltransferase [Yoonia vestfoldensis]
MSDFPWLETLQGAAAVDVAARSDLLARLAEGAGTVACPPVLESLLIGAGVLHQTGEGPVLTAGFAQAWRRDAAGIMARASFIRRAAADVATGLDDLVSDVPAFMAKSATFRLFRYDMAEGISAQHLAATRPWVDYVESLSQSEIPLLLPLIDVRPGDRVLEIGGNTGLLSAALVAAHHGVTAQVLDLPAVCVLGDERRGSDTLRFVPGDARKAETIKGFAGAVDVVVFKSVLHDWPEADAAAMIARSAAILPAGGRLVICERGAFGASDAAGKDMMALANLVFSPFYRDPAFYEGLMTDLGLRVARAQVDCDMIFHVTTGQRP